jgi:hypothetical protein
MQMRSRMYFHFISLWHSFRDGMSPHDERAPAETSPSLIYIAVVLTLLLIILEIDDHRAELEALGLLTDNFPVPAVFLGP